MCVIWRFSHRLILIYSRNWVHCKQYLVGIWPPSLPFVLQVVGAHDQPLISKQWWLYFCTAAWIIQVASPFWVELAKKPGQCEQQWWNPTLKAYKCGYVKMLNPKVILHYLLLPLILHSYTILPGRKSWPLMVALYLLLLTVKNVKGLIIKYIVISVFTVTRCSNTTQVWIRKTVGQGCCRKGKIWRFTSKRYVCHSHYWLGHINRKGLLTLLVLIKQIFHSTFRFM